MSLLLVAQNLFAIDISFKDQYGIRKKIDCSITNNSNEQKVKSLIACVLSQHPEMFHSDGGCLIAADQWRDIFHQAGMIEDKDFVAIDSYYSLVATSQLKKPECRLLYDSGYHHFFMIKGADSSWKYFDPAYRQFLDPAIKRASPPVFFGTEPELVKHFNHLKPHGKTVSRAFKTPTSSGRAFLAYSNNETIANHFVTSVYKMSNKKESICNVFDRNLKALRGNRFLEECTKKEMNRICKKDLNKKLKRMFRTAEDISEELYKLHNEVEKLNPRSSTMPVQK